MIDYDLLKKNIVFPIKEDTYYHSYIWDSNNNMVAQFEEESTEEEYQLLLGDLVIFSEEQVNNEDKYILHEGNFIRNSDNTVIGCVRGWGRLSSLGINNPKQRQDNIALYLLTCLNNRL